MIRIGSIETRGKSNGGEFVGRLDFAPGLQVISGHNSFGKTLAAESIAWCLNLEATFGRKESDPTFLPEAVLEELSLPDAKNVKVLSSEAILTLIRGDGEELELSRAITHDRDRIRITRRPVDGEPSRLTLLTGSGTMADPTIGFQRYLFEWLGWPPAPTTTFEGRSAFVYIENLSPLFYIEQQEGWTEIQARQIGRYGQQQIRELSVEYLLGALDSVNQRVERQRTATLEAALRASAKSLADRVSETFLKQGWAVDWSGIGSVREVESRWSAKTIREALFRDAEVDIDALRKIAVDQVVSLRKALTAAPIDPSNVTAGAGASQLVVDLKRRRHELNSELRTLHGQFTDNEHLHESLGHRIRTATDVHRYKTTGVGRLAHLECPTCHRELAAADFSLTEQTADEVAAHIEALKRDRAVTKQTLNALANLIRKAEAELVRVDSELHHAQRSLEDVTTSVGPVREQLVRTAAQLAAQERYLEKLRETEAELTTLQDLVNKWLEEAKGSHALGTAGTDLQQRIAVFTAALGQYLKALGHSAIIDRGLADLRLDSDHYEPFLGHRRLRTLGSGSDPARLVAAYTLALAAASATLKGLHPGVVILDEPLQQNPDTPHVELFLDFLSNDLAKNARFQTLVFTFLNDFEVKKLRDGGTKVITVDGHFLAPVPSPPPAAEAPAEPE